MKILFVASECAPFAKTGGLGDVVGSLPPFLKNLSYDVRVVMPLYSMIDKEKFGIVESTKQMSVKMGTEVISCSVYKSKISGDVPVYFIDYPPFFHRYGIYHDQNFHDYADNPKRYSFLSMAAIQLCRELVFKPDIIHAHDWHTAILSAYLKRVVQDDPLFNGTASILTIHNLAYQGKYAWWFWEFTGLSWEEFNPDRFEEYKAINFLKGGIYYADMVNTVSRGYAEETLTKEGGYGLDYFLKQKGSKYIGILNGVDYSHWDPARDPLIPAQYSAYHLDGKSIAKEHLQKYFHLKQDRNVPVIGIISRLVEQKGFYVLQQCLESILRDMNVQFAVLGSGDKSLEQFFTDLSTRFPDKIGSHIGYNNDLAHQIEAGSDFFLMPSIYEPCGLNQIYSLKYGSLPIVHATGGLKETVENYNQHTGEGTGFKFWDATPQAIYGTVKWALETWFYRKEHIEMLIQNAMQQHFSWDESAREYIKMYRRAISNSSVMV